jgi:ribonuclease P protein component
VPRVAPTLDATGKFPRTARVRRRREFTRIQGEGVRVHTSAFTIVAARRSRDERARLGLTVSKRVGNAVVRNRVRRLVKEIFRRLAGDLSEVDLVVIAKPGAALVGRKGFDAVAAEIVPAIGDAIARVQKKDRSP